MNPGQNLVLARFLASPPPGVPEEASHRAACGRAYYAAFTTARDLLISAGLQVESNAGAHGTVARLLKASTDEQVRHAGATLRFLRYVRNEADYDVGLVTSGRLTFDQSLLRRTLASAGFVIQQLRRVQREDRRLRIPPGIH